MVNKVILVGRLATEPEVKASPKGVYVAKLRLATNTYAGKDDDGNSKHFSDFHNLVLFGKQAEFAGQHLQKGKLIYADGRLQTSSWEDAAGVKKYWTEVIVDQLTLLDPKPKEAAA
jgi:single-strand DNA-binding protein